MNPLIITPRIHTMQEAVMLEATIENATQAPLFIESVKLDPVSLFICNDLNQIDQDKVKTKTLETTFSQNIVYMKPSTARQYLFMLTPKYPTSPEAKASIAIGKLEVVWKSTLGEVGKLTTAPLLRKILAEEVDLIVSYVPPRIILERPFVVTFLITNKAPKVFASCQLLVS